MRPRSRSSRSLPGERQDDRVSSHAQGRFFLWTIRAVVAAHGTVESAKDTYAKDQETA